MHDDCARLSARAGAAVLLSLEGDADTRRRLRSALDRVADSLADPKQRTAIHRLAKGLTGAALAEIMAGIEA
jgi:hypothetical protein